MTDYDNGANAWRPPAHILARLTTPDALRARAAIRLEIARQDLRAGDGAAYLRNLQIATDLERRARDAR